jgi:hypothetical protein
MAINTLKPNIGEIDCVRCVIIESGISPERMCFLKDLLEFNNYEVIIDKGKTDDSKYMIGVTNITFNPVYAIYERQLKTKEGHKVSPAYWKQETTVCDPNYWIMRDKNI